MGRARRRITLWAILWSCAAIALAPSLAPATEPPPAAAQGVLVIEVTGLPSPGTLHLELYAASGLERWGTPMRRERLAVAEDSAEWRVEALPQGEYAVRVFLDQNGNGNLDRSRSGLPSEPFGFSNNARRRFGVPRLKTAAFSFASAEQRIGIQLRARARETTAELPAPAAAAPAAPSPDNE